METVYIKTDKTVSLIKYHFVFCPRYRRKIFLIPNVEEQFKNLVNIKCKEMGIEVLAIKCNNDHVYMFLNCLPIQSPANIIKQIKSYTGKILRDEFAELSKMPNLWTKNFFVSTEEKIDKKIILDYVEKQRKRY